MIGENDTFADVCTGASGCSFSVWTYRTSRTRGDFSLARWDSSGDDRFFYIQQLASTTNQTWFWLSKNGMSGSDACLARGGDLSLNEWHHIVGVWDNVANQTKIYLDGVLNVTQDCDFDEINGTEWAEDQDTFIGSWMNPTQSFNGTIDEVSIWNRSLSAIEIAEMHNLSSGKYFWEANVTDGLLNTTSPRFEFTVGGALSCNIDCTVTDIISSNLECGGSNLSFIGVDRDTDSVRLTANITGYDQWNMHQCMVVGIDHLRS